MANNPFLDGALRVLREVTARASRSSAKSSARSSRRASTGSPASSTAKPPRSPKRSGATAGNGYPGDFTSRPRIAYSPNPDGRPDPGEVVWTWVPYEENHAEGKDRPVLLIGRDGQWLLGLQITSQDHDRDAGQEARAGRYWVDIGAGEWDPKRRPSEVRVNRIVRIDPEAVRRVGAILDRDRFNTVTRELAKHY